MVEEFFEAGVYLLMSKMSDDDKNNDKCKGCLIAVVTKSNRQLKNIIFVFLCFFFANLTVLAIDIAPLDFHTNNKNGEGFYYVGNMIESRYNHSAVKLKDGRIFIAGGTLLDSTEVFDVKTGKSTKGPKMSHERANPLLFLLKNGNVLILGQMTFSSTNKIDVYNPTTNTILNIGEIDIPYCSFNKNTALVIELNNDKILITSLNFLFDNLFEYNLTNNEFKKINTNKKLIDNKKYTLDNSYIAQLEDYLYILNKRTGTIIKTEINNLGKINAKTDLYVHKYFRYLDNKFVVLDDFKKVLFFKSNSIHFFDFETGNYTDVCCPVNFQPQYMRKIFTLNNNNILIISYKYPDKSYKLIEFNPSTKEIITKKYHYSNANAEILEIDKGKILFIGGKIPQRSKSNKKIYVWKEGNI